MSEEFAKKKLFVSQKRESAVDVVINTIKDLILHKKLKPGDRLPSEPELAESFDISRGSIREAMKILSAFGIVDIKRGDGTYIAEAFNKDIFDPLLFRLILEGDNPRELVELRELMELGIVKLIIKNAGKEELEELQEIHDEMSRKLEEGLLDSREFAQHDLAFHKALGHVTKNKLVERIYNFVLEFFAYSIEQTHQNENENEVSMLALSLHRGILEALTERDLEKATQAVQESIDSWKIHL